MYYRFMPNQDNHFEHRADLLRIDPTSGLAPPSLQADLFRSAIRACQENSTMSGQVVLYFEDQSDALRFALAAGSVMAGEGGKFTSDLLENTARVSRIRLDTVNACSKKANSGKVA